MSWKAQQCFPNDVLEPKSAPGETPVSAACGWLAAEPVECSQKGNPHHVCGVLEKWWIYNSGSCSLLPERTYNMISCRAGPALTLGLHHRSALLKIPGWQWSSAPVYGGSKCPVNGMLDCWNQDWYHKLVLDEPPLLQLSWDGWEHLLCWKSWTAWFHFKLVFFFFTRVTALL